MKNEVPKKITIEWLKEKGACRSGLKWFESQTEQDPKKVLLKLVDESYADWANWTIAHMMTRVQCVKFAIFAAEQVFPIWEKQHQDDKSPRKAIEAAEKLVENPCKENADAYAAACADACSCATYAAYACGCAADSANKESMQLRILNYGMELIGLK